MPDDNDFCEKLQRLYLIFLFLLFILSFFLFSLILIVSYKNNMDSVDTICLVFSTMAICLPRLLIASTKLAVRQKYQVLPPLPSLGFFFYYSHFISFQ